MAGPLLVVVLPGPVPAEGTAELGVALKGMSTRFHEARTGSFDLAVDPSRLGAPGTAPRTFAVTVSGPGFGDEAVFDAAHAAEPDLEPLIGFHPTHDVVVSATADDRADHMVVAHLAAAVQETLGGLIDVKVYRDDLPAARRLPGAVATLADGESWPRVFGTAEFLRAWAEVPQFRVVRGWYPSHW